MTVDASTNARYFFWLLTSVAIVKKRVSPQKKCAKCKEKTIKAEHEYCRKCWCKVKPLTVDALLKSCEIPKHLWLSIKTLQLEGIDTINALSGEMTKRFVRNMGVLYTFPPYHKCIEYCGCYPEDDCGCEYEALDRKGIHVVSIEDVTYYLKPK